MALGMATLWRERRRTDDARRHEREALRFTFAISDEVAGRALARIAAPGRPPAGDDEGLCRRALGYYEGLASRYRSDPEMIAIAAAAEHRAGFLRTILREPGAEASYRRSVGLYDAIIAARPDDPAPRVERSVVLVDHAIHVRATRGSPAALPIDREVLAARQEIVERFPEPADYRISLALTLDEVVALLDRAGRGAEAEALRSRLEAAYEAAIARSPNHTRLLNNLAWALARRPGRSSRDSARAVTLAERAVALGPTAGAAWNTLDVARYRAGDWAGALKALDESCRRRGGGDPFDRLPAAMARWRLGDRATARALFDRSRAWIDSHPDPGPDLARSFAEAARRIGRRSARP
ncbi:MAG TPA: hypothetical protein VG406_19305 [Isosphaeraceae bacterium]|jgi:tetratricopeptide (TPR) repeat protein|nr:hypothetical protein [Isosphaeraceae bacterium]